MSGEESPDHETIIRAVQEMLLKKYGSTTPRSRSCPFRPARWSTAATATEGTILTHMPLGLALS